LDITPPSLCVPIVYHQPLREVESAYIHGDPFPALTSACCLGERILNHIILTIRDDFRASPRYKEVYKKTSFQDWNFVIDVLTEWGILTGELSAKFRNLLDLRNPAVHFGSLEDSMTKAKIAVQLVYDTTDKLFGLSAEHFFVVSGEVYVAQEKETSSLVRNFILPYCNKVGYKHSVEGTPEGLKISDNNQYEDAEISDKEFTRLREEFCQSGMKSND
jgi:hypothetical protein